MLWPSASITGNTASGQFPSDAVAIQDQVDALIHSREGRTVHGHTLVGVTSHIQLDLVHL